MSVVFLCFSVGVSDDCGIKESIILYSPRSIPVRRVTVSLQCFGIFTFTFVHLADVFIQSDLQCIQAILISMCVP